MAVKGIKLNGISFIGEGGGKGEPDEYIKKIEVVKEKKQLEITDKNDTKEIYDPMSFGLPRVINKVADYVYEATYDTLDWDFAEANVNGGFRGACSSVYKNGILGRNFDWKYNKENSCVVKVGNTIAVCGAFKDFAEDKELTEDVKRLIPFYVMDGMNGAGLGVSVLVVRNEKQAENCNPSGAVEKTINSILLPRYIIDNFTKVDDVVVFLQQHCKVVFPADALAAGEVIHLHVADRTKAVVVEWTKDGVLTREIDRVTNFYLGDVVLNADGSVYTNYSQDAGHKASETNKVTPYGMGLERFNLLGEGLAESVTIRHVLNGLKYTNTYKELDSAKIWHSEFTSKSSGITVDTQADDATLANIEQSARNEFAGRSRDGKTWQTVSSSVYDLEALTLDVWFQEDENNSRSYSLEGGKHKGVDDVVVDGASVVEGNVANIELKDVYVAIDQKVENADRVLVTDKEGKVTLGSGANPPTLTITLPKAPVEYKKGDIEVIELSEGQSKFLNNNPNAILCLTYNDEVTLGGRQNIYLTFKGNTLETESYKYCAWGEPESAIAIGIGALGIVYKEGIEGATGILQIGFNDTFIRIDGYEDEDRGKILKVNDENKLELQELDENVLKIEGSTIEGKIVLNAEQVKYLKDHKECKLLLVRKYTDEGKAVEDRVSFSPLQNRNIETKDTFRYLVSPVYVGEGFYSAKVTFVEGGENKIDVNYLRFDNLFVKKQFYEESDHHKGLFVDTTGKATFSLPNSQYGEGDRIYASRNVYLNTKAALLKKDKSFECSDMVRFDSDVESPDGVVLSKWIIDVKAGGVTTDKSLDNVSAKLVAYAVGDSGESYTCHYFGGVWSEWEQVGAGAVVPLSQDDYDALPDEDKQKENVAYLVENDDDAVEALFTDKLVDSMKEKLWAEMLNKICPIGSYAFGVKPAFGDWEEITGNRALWLKDSVADGTEIEQALPNITGAIRFNSQGGLFTDESNTYKKGALKTGDKMNYTLATSGTNAPWINNGKGYELAIDASDSNAIYKNGANVQPNAYVMKVFKRIG